MPLGAGGRFGETLAYVGGDTSWTAIVGGFRFLQQGTATASVHPLYPSELAWTDHTFTGSGAIKVAGVVGAPNGHVPTGWVQLQQSTDGRTGWATVAAVTLDEGAFNTWHTMSRPSGYLRLFYPGTADSTAVTSPVVHLTRAATRITGFVDVR